MDNSHFSARRTRRGFLRDASVITISATMLGALGKGALAKAAAWDKQFELKVDFEISHMEGSRYHRPFVAVWVEDADTIAVRTLCLWVQQTSKGSRWIPDLKRWFRDEKERRVLSGGDLTKTISSATRMPGKYSLSWNGRDDQGSFVPQGNYTLCIEAAREHGTYQIIRVPIVVGSKTWEKTGANNVEIKNVKVSFSQK